MHIHFLNAKLGCSGSKTSQPVSAAVDDNTQTRDVRGNDNTSSAMTAPKISFPAENSPQRANSTGSFNIRAKVVPLKPGRSLMDWIRLGKSGQDLTGTGGIARPVTVEELSKHNTESDAWICIRGIKECSGLILVFFCAHFSKFYRCKYSFAGMFSCRTSSLSLSACKSRQRRSK